MNTRTFESFFSFGIALTLLTSSAALADFAYVEAGRARDGKVGVYVVEKDSDLATELYDAFVRGGGKEDGFGDYRGVTLNEGNLSARVRLEGSDREIWFYSHNGLIKALSGTPVGARRARAAIQIEDHAADQLIRVLIRAGVPSKSKDGVISIETQRISCVTHSGDPLSATCTLHARN